MKKSKLKKGNNIKAKYGFSIPDEERKLKPDFSPISPIDINPQRQPLRQNINMDSTASMIPVSHKNNNFDLSNAIALGLSGIDALIPNQRAKSPVVQPYENYSYNPNAYGTGSQMLMKKGGSLTPNKARKILHDGTVYGKPLTDKQRKFFGAQSQGNTMKYVDGGNISNPPLLTSISEGDPDEGKRFKKRKGLNNELNHNYGFSGIIDDKGRNIDNPTENEAIKTMLQFMNHNWDLNSPSPSNNYRPVWQHTSYDPQQQPAQNTAKQGGKMTAKSGIQIEGNQYSQLSPSILQVEGNYHKDGGTDLSFGGKTIEAEKGEPISMDKDGNLTIFGNLNNPLTGNKYKKDAQMLAKKENKARKIFDDGLELINNNDPKGKWSSYAFNSGKAMLHGGKGKLDEITKAKEHLGDLQNAHLQLIGEEDHTAANGKKMYPDGGTLDNKYKTLKENTFKRLQELYPGKNIELKEQGARDINSQKSYVKGKASKTDVSLHNFNAARDYLIYVDGKVVKDPNVYKQTVQAEAKNLGLFNIGDWDPGHIGAVQEGKPNTFGRLFEQYPELKNDPRYKQSIDYLNNRIQNGNATKQEIKYYNQATGNKIDISKGVNPDYSKEPSLNKDKGSYFNQFFIPKGTPEYTPEGNYTLATPPENKPHDWGEDTPPANTPTKLNNYDFNFTDKTTTPYSNAKPLNLTNVLGEAYSLATNKQEPVFMQQYQPELYNPYQVSFQDRTNQNNRTFNASQQLVGYNPEALSSMSGELYNANNQVAGDEFRTNQGIASDITNKNISLLNEAKGKNLQLADIQYGRQEQAKSNTKAINQEALNSISSKVLQNTRENNQLKVYENLYPHYRFGDNYQKDYVGPKAVEAIDWQGNSVNSMQGNTQYRYKNGQAAPYQTTVLSPTEQAIKEEQLKHAKDKDTPKLKSGGKITLRKWLSSI